MDLKTRHQQAIESLGGVWDEGFYKDLVLRYDEPHRAYHNLEHIGSCVARLSHWHGDEVPPTLLLAALYHDAVYIPGFSYNETLSAYMADAHLDYLGIRDEFIEDVMLMILTTKTHTCDAEDPALSAELIDADLYELGTDHYAENGKNIELEFLTVVGVEAFREGRAKWLTSFLGRDSIYLMPGQEELEAKARENMENELLGLR